MSKYDYYCMCVWKHVFLSHYGYTPQLNPQMWWEVKDTFITIYIFPISRVHFRVDFWILVCIHLLYMAKWDRASLWTPDFTNIMIKLRLLSSSSQDRAAMNGSIDDRMEIKHHHQHHMLKQEVFVEVSSLVCGDAFLFVISNYSYSGLQCCNSRVVS